MLPRRSRRCVKQHATLTYMALQLGASAAYEETVATAACFYNEAFTIPAIKVRAGVRVRHTHTPSDSPAPTPPEVERSLPRKRQRLLYGGSAEPK